MNAGGALENHCFWTANCRTPAAHVRAALTQTSLSIPVQDGNMALGTWQGIYLYEHRRAGQLRQVAAHFLGE